MAEKSYTMDDLNLAKKEETTLLKRRSSQGDQPYRDHVSVLCMVCRPKVSICTLIYVEMRLRLVFGLTLHPISPNIMKRL